MLRTLRNAGRRSSGINIPSQTLNNTFRFTCPLTTWSRDSLSSTSTAPRKLQNEERSSRQLHVSYIDVANTGSAGPGQRRLYANAAHTPHTEGAKPLLGTRGRPCGPEDWPELKAQQQKLKRDNPRAQQPKLPRVGWESQERTAKIPSGKPALSKERQRNEGIGKLKKRGRSSDKTDKIPKLDAVASPNKDITSTVNNSKQSDDAQPNEAVKPTGQTKKQSPRKMKNAKSVNSRKLSLVKETSVDVAPVEAGDQNKHEFDDLPELTPTQLEKGPDLSVSYDEVTESDQGTSFDFPSHEEQEELLGLALDYAQEESERMSRSLRAIGGNYTRGTKSHPEKGNLDPRQILEMEMEMDAGGEDALSAMRDMISDVDWHDDQGPIAVSKNEPEPSPVEPTKAKRTRRKSAKSAETTADVTKDDSAHATTKKPATTRRTGKAIYPSSLEKTNARYGMDAAGNRTPTRFQWWQRATSRDPRSKVMAKRVMATRKAPLVRRLTADEYWYKSLKLYTDNFVPLIEAEHVHEEKVIRERLSTMTAEKLVAEGYCLNELTATQDSTAQAGRPTYTFALGGKGARRFMWNRFNPGTSVIISPAGEKVDPIIKEQGKRASANTTYNTGSVVSKTPGSLKVSFDERLKDDNLSRFCRLDIWTSDIVVRRAKEALATLHHDPVAIDRHDQSKVKSLEVSPDEIADSETDSNVYKRPPVQTVLPGTALRPVLLDGFIPKDSDIPSPAELSSPGFFADNELIQSWCRRQLVEGRNPVEIEGDPLFTLNTSQRRAIATMLSRNISLVQGPPGTGKTRTIIEMLQLLKVHWQVPQPILVSAYTNTACDNLAEGMSKRGLKVLRYGSRSRIREDLKELTLEWYLDQHKHKWILAHLKAETYRTPKDDPNRENLRRKVFGLERRMMLDVLLDVDVVCATCISSRGRLLEVVDFPVVFLDEASMATEPNALIPLTKGCQHAALIGDHKQLPPLVISTIAEGGHLQTSLFERLIKSGKIPSVMLDTQYRMHPAISAFPNKAFYDSKLMDGTLDETGAAKAGLEPPRSDLTKNDDTGLYRTVTFLHHTGQEITRAKSIVNESEAKIIYDVVVDLLLKNPNLKGDDIGVIAPYAGQISCIVNEMRHDSKRQEQAWKTLGEKRSKEMNDVEVHTVDGFEGREKKIIVFSTTRSNDANSIGFLADWRRMNVGLTRAKAGLIIVGNRHTLENARQSTVIESPEKAGAEHWRNLIRDLDAANAIVDLEPALLEDTCSEEEVDFVNENLEDNYDSEDLFQETVRMTA